MEVKKNMKAAGIFSVFVGISMVLMWLMFYVTGALIYTMVQSPGYFIQNGEPGFVAMFAVLIIVALVLLTRLLKRGGV